MVDGADVRQAARRSRAAARGRARAPRAAPPISAATASRVGLVAAGEDDVAAARRRRPRRARGRCRACLRRRRRCPEPPALSLDDCALALYTAADLDSGRGRAGERAQRPERRRRRRPRRLRAERERRGISLRELARRLEISPSAISQIETGRARPSVATLWAIVTELGMSLDDLFAHETGAPPAARARPAPPDPPPASLPVVTAAAREALQLATGVRWERMTADADPDVDFIWVVYDAGGSSSPEDSFIRHAGREYGLVLSGRLEVTVGFETTRPRPGRLDLVRLDDAAPAAQRRRRAGHGRVGRRRAASRPAPDRAAARPSRSSPRAARAATARRAAPARGRELLGRRSPPPGRRGRGRRPRARRRRRRARRQHAPRGARQRRRLSVPVRRRRNSAWATR